MSNIEAFATQNGPMAPQMNTADYMDQHVTYMDPKAALADPILLDKLQGQAYNH